MVMRWLDRFFKSKTAERPKEETPPAETQPETAEPLLPLLFTAEPLTEGAWLQAVTSDGETIYLPLTRSPLVLGTDRSCDVVLEERLAGKDKVFAQHARLELWRERWVIAPLSKEVPVFVNGRRTGENVLRDGTEITLGENGVRFVFHIKP